MAHTQSDIVARIARNSLRGPNLFTHCKKCGARFVVDHYIGLGGGGWAPVYACPKNCKGGK